MTLIVTPKNKKEEALLKAFLTNLQIDFHSEKEEDKALYKAMLEGKKSGYLSETEKNAFLKKLKQGK